MAMLQKSFILVITFFVISANLAAQSHLEIKLKCSQKFRMQIFYIGPQITKKWSEKYSAFKQVERSNEFVTISIKLKTKHKITNFRVDFGEVAENEITLESISLINNGETEIWDKREIFDEFFFNSHFVIISANEGIKAMVTAARGKIIDPFIHLSQKNNRLTHDRTMFSRYTLLVKSNSGNRITGTFSFEHDSHLSISKNHSSAMDSVSFKIFGQKNYRKAAFGLGTNYSSEYDIYAFKIENQDFKRDLVGDKILKYFDFNLYTEVIEGNSLHVNTKVYDGEYYPGFYSKNPIKSEQEEFVILLAKVLILIISVVLLYMLNKNIFRSDQRLFWFFR